MKDFMSNENAKVYLNGYQESQAYGGPEEGGWYYRVGTIMRSEVTECSCPMEHVLLAHYKNIYDEYDEFVRDELEFMLRGLPEDHEDTCPARILAESWRRPKQKAYFPEAYITANGTWSPDSMEDAPEDYAGETVHIDPNLVIRIEVSEGKDWPEYTPHYE